MRRRVAALFRQLRWTLGIYLGSRVLLLVVALVDLPLFHRSLTSELGNWDGFWYVKLATQGYPRSIPHVYSTLGFFPLYSMVMWLVAHVLFCSYVIAGVLISGVGGLVATVLVQRLCTNWWGEANGRRAVLFFCFFPGSVVFSMVYSEGLLIPLAAGCLIALQRRRWLLAGVLAGFATAIGPDAVAIIAVCAVAALLELRRRGWRDRDAWRSLIAPALSPVGLCAFGAFLWIWNGTPFACFDAQHYAWGEKTDALALVNQAKTLFDEIRFPHFDYHAINLNLVAGTLGAILLVIGVVLMLKKAYRPPATAITWSLGIGFLAVTSRIRTSQPAPAHYRLPRRARHRLLCQRPRFCKAHGGKYGLPRRDECHHLRRLRPASLSRNGGFSGRAARPRRDPRNRNWPFRGGDNALGERRGAEGSSTSGPLLPPCRSRCPHGSPRTRDEGS